MNTSFSGTWVGGVVTTSCESDGNFASCGQFPRLSDITSPPITNIRLTLTQSGDAVVGDMDFNTAWRAEVRAGSIRVGRLSFNPAPQGAIASQGLSFAIESWDSVLSGATGTTMDGDFTFRVYRTSGSPSGSARYRIRLVGVTRQ